MFHHPKVTQDNYLFAATIWRGGHAEKVTKWSVIEDSFRIADFSLPGSHFHRATR